MFAPLQRAVFCVFLKSHCLCGLVRLLLGSRIFGTRYAQPARCRLAEVSRRLRMAEQLALRLKPRSSSKENDYADGKLRVPCPMGFRLGTWRPRRDGESSRRVRDEATNKVSLITEYCITLESSSPPDGLTSRTSHPGVVLCGIQTRGVDSKGRQFAEATGAKLSGLSGRRGTGTWSSPPQ